MERRRFIAASALFAAFARLANAQRKTYSIEGSNGDIAVLGTSTGPTSITINSLGWTFPVGVSKLQNARVVSGTDNIGDYEDLSWSLYPPEHPGYRTLAIRAYQTRPIVQITVGYPKGAPNDGAFLKLGIPPNLFQFRNAGWAHLFSGITPDGPTLLFDRDKKSVVASAVTNITRASATQSDDGTIVFGIQPAVQYLPIGFSHSIILAFSPGISTAWETWGQTLRDLYQRERSDGSDILNKKISYWTDSFAAYYYRANFDYWNTLLSLPGYFANTLGVALGSLQLDSWSYPKGDPSKWTTENPSWVLNGLGEYEVIESPDLFPASKGGLAAFQKSLGLPLIQHTRWMNNPNAYDSSAISGGAIVSQDVWNKIAGAFASKGIDVLELDWLSAGNSGNPADFTADERFLTSALDAMKALGKTVQLCMPDPHHFVFAGTNSAVTNIRGASDGFGRDIDAQIGLPAPGADRYDQLAYTSPIIWAAGARPFADAVHVVASNTRDLIVAVLTAGPVGIGNEIGTVNAVDLQKAALRDGTIVNPDVPLMPIDDMYVVDALGVETPLTQTTYTLHGDRRTLYAFSYERTRGLRGEMRLPLQSLGMAGSVIIHDYLNDTSVPWDASTDYVATVDDHGSYFVVAPIASSGIALIGDVGKFVMAGRERFASIETDDSGTIHATISFTPGETGVTLLGYSTASGNVVASATNGSVSNPVFRSDGTFMVSVVAGTGNQAVITMLKSD
jgi:hypothetical protein